MEADFGAHPGKIKHAAGFFVTTFDSFDFHGDRFSITSNVKSRKGGLQIWRFKYARRRKAKPFRFSLSAFWQVGCGARNAIFDGYLKPYRKFFQQYESW